MNTQKTIKEGITSGQSIVWHRTRKKNLESIQKNGFIVGEGDVLGRGIYACFDFTSQLTDGHIMAYGEIILESKVKSLDGFLILFPNEAKKVYGNKWRFKDQLLTVFGRNLYKQENFDVLFGETVFNDVDNGAYEKLDGYEFYYKYLYPYYKNFKGLVYNSNDEGKCIVSYQKENIIPLRFTEDDGKTWQPFVNKDIYKIGNIDNPLNYMFKRDVNEKKYNLSEDVISDFKKIKHEVNKPKFIGDYAGRFSVHNFPKQYVKDLSDYQISQVIFANNEFIRFFTKNDLNTLSSELLTRMLYNSPNLIRHKNIIPLDKLTPEDVMNLIYNHPSLISDLDITKLNSEQIGKLLYHDKTGFLHNILDLSKLDAIDIRNLIYNKANFVNILPLRKLDGKHITTLILHNFDLLSDPNLNKLDLSLLSKVNINQLAKKYGTTINPYFGITTPNGTSSTNNSNGGGFSGVTNTNSQNSSSATTNTPNGGSGANNSPITNGGSGANNSPKKDSNNATSKPIKDSGIDPEIVNNVALNARKYTIDDFPRQYIKYLTSKNITDILTRNRDLLGLFTTIDLNKLSKEQVGFIIIKQPDLASEFNLDIFSKKDIPKIIMRNTKLITKFKADVLMGLSLKDKNEIIKIDANLKKYFIKPKPETVKTDKPKTNTVKTDKPKTNTAKTVKPTVNKKGTTKVSKPPINEELKNKIREELKNYL